MFVNPSWSACMSHRNLGITPVINGILTTENMPQAKERIGNGVYFADTCIHMIKLNKDLTYSQGFLKIVESKLSNKKFVDNAPKKLVENEKNKLKDAKEKIRILTEKINSLS